jgi:CDP-paratose 2-epimerase
MSHRLRKPRKKDMRIIVTGAAGFLGTHVCEYLTKKGHKITGIDNLTMSELRRTGYSPQVTREYNIDFLRRQKTALLMKDIINWSEIEKVEGDFIIHCAAQPAMTIALEQPRLDLQTNVVGTFNMLELARKIDAPIVTCSTIHVYGNKVNQFLKEKKTRFVGESTSEDDPTLQGDMTPLHASKMSTELYVRTYIETYGLKAAVFRLTGMYGPRQFAGMDHGWVSNFIIRTLTMKPIIIFGTDKQVRDILFATDACKAFEAFLENQISGTYNIGGGIRNSISLKECLAKIREITGLEQSICFKPPRFGDLHYFVCDISKARKNLKWAPKVSTNEGLRKTIEWAKKNKTLFRVDR